MLLCVAMSVEVFYIAANAKMGSNVLEAAVDLNAKFCDAPIDMYILQQPQDLHSRIFFHVQTLRRRKRLFLPLRATT